MTGRSTSPRLLYPDSPPTARHGTRSCTASSSACRPPDTANHWAAGLTAERPESYRGIIELLEADKAIPSRLAKDLKGLFSLRNVLIHKYADLDLARLHGHLRRGSAPMRAFLKLAKAQVRPAA